MAGYVLVRLGTGKQVAFVMRDDGTRLKVQKWSAQGRKWTGSVFISRDEVIGRAGTDDMRSYHVGVAR